MVGAYYFDGWAGRHRLADTAAWAKDAPTHLTRRMLDEFPDREPIWGWRDDRQEIVEQQIDLAADHGGSRGPVPDGDRQNAVNRGPQSIQVTCLP